MAIHALSPENVREYIKRRLGHPETVVELTDEQLDDATQDILRKCNQHMFESQLRVQYACTDSVVIGLGGEARGVLMVKALFPQSQAIYAQMNIFEMMYRMVYPRLPIGEWYTLRMFYKMYQRVRGTEPDWYIDEMNKVLYVNCISGPYDVFYMVTFDLTTDSFFKGRRQYLQLFLDGAVARAKIVLGRVRGKWGGSVPAPGGMLATDAATLIAEGKAELEAFEQQIRAVGIAIGAVMWG